MSADPPAGPDGAPPARRSPLIAIFGAVVTTAIDAALLALALGGPGALLAHRRALALLRPVRREAGARRAGDPALMVVLLLMPLIAAPLAAWGERVGLLPLP